MPITSPFSDNLATMRWRRSKPVGAGAHDRVRLDLIAREPGDWRLAGLWRPMRRAFFLCSCEGQARSPFQEGLAYAPW